MKIVITSTGTGLDARVDPRFGRCAYFALVDPESRALEAVANPFQDGTGGAGTQAAQWVVGQGVGALLTGHCGPNATTVLDDAGIRIVEGVSGTVGEAIEHYARNELTATPYTTEPIPQGARCGGGPGLGLGRGPGRGRGPGAGRGLGRGRGRGLGRGGPMA